MAQPAHILSLDGDSVRIPADAFEQAGFRRWVGSSSFPDRARASFAEGEVFVDMSPESIEVHNKVKTVVTVELGGLVRPEDLGEFYSDRALLTNEPAGLSTERRLCELGNAGSRTAETRTWRPGRHRTRG
jgi:hypothetical protein